MFAVCVTFTLRPETAADFIALVTENARLSVRDEPGCHRFDVCAASADDGEVFLYELYTDAAAFEAHLATPHFAEFDRRTREMVTEKIIKTYTWVREGGARP